MKIASMSLAAVVVAGGVAVSSATGSGEPKNQAPFFHAVPSGTIHAGRALYAAGRGASLIQPEPKNERPFTRPASDDPGLAVALRQIALYEFPSLGDRRRSS